MLMAIIIIIFIMKCSLPSHDMDTSEYGIRDVFCVLTLKVGSYPYQF